MKKLIFNKLIRDKISANLKKKGVLFKTRVLKNKEYERKLIKKVTEESLGVFHAKNRQELTEELADLVDVVEEIRKLNKITPKALLDQREENQKKEGGFKKRLFLLWTSDDGYKTKEKS